MKYTNFFIKFIYIIFISQKLISMNSEDEELFFLAIEKNDINSIKKIVIKEININFIYYEKEFRNFTPLHYASFLGNLEIVKFLIEQDNIDINCKDIELWTPLHWAIHRGHAEIVKLLLKHKKIDINAKTNNLRTPLHNAMKELNLEIIKLLLSADNIEINCIESMQGLTPLHIAIYHRYFDAIQILMKHRKINTQIKDHKGRTIYDYAKAKKISLIQNNQKIKVD